MRIIKFRAYSKDTKEMLPWSEFMTEWFEDEDIVLMQFTGLLDKNGKEIYQDDLLKDESEGLWRVVYDVTQTAFIGDSLDDDVDDGLPLGQLEYEMEVVGNIYENPDLLASTTQL